MSQPDLARPGERAEQDVTAIADTVVDIHTRVQALQQAQRDQATTLVSLRGKVEGMQTGLAAMQQVQHEHRQQLGAIQDTLAAILDRLDNR
ncbi:MAG: hypothetical protein ACRDRN_04495 [Sciscionella sp.]